MSIVYEHRRANSDKTSFCLLQHFLGRSYLYPSRLPGTKFHKAKNAAATIKKELQIIVKQRKKALENKIVVASQDLLSHLLTSPDENGKFMSESVIINNILLLLFAGHDTSSSTMTMLIRALAQHPQVYVEVLAEQNEIATSKAGDFLQWEDVQKIRYSWNVVCETMRLWPSVIGVFREALVDINYEGYDIPKGGKMRKSCVSPCQDQRRGFQFALST